jgi:phage baseplate assembly protein W
MMAKLQTATANIAQRLGADCKFPIQGNFQPITGTDLLLQDIQLLLLTMPGERVNRPEFGCFLRTMIWENIEVAASRGAASISQAIREFEPRVTLVDVSSEINRNTGLIIFSIKFIVNSTDTSANLIFPFRAGTALSFA